MAAELDVEEAVHGDQDEHDQQGHGGDAAAGFLELPAEGDEVAGRQVDPGVDGGPRPPHRTGEVGARHVGGDHRHPLRVLAPDERRSESVPDLRDGAQPHQVSGRRRDRKRRDLLGRGPEARRQADGDIGRQAVLDDLASYYALEECLHSLSEVRKGKPVPGDGRAIEVDHQLRDRRLLLVRQVDDAGHGAEDLLDPGGERPQHRQVRPEDLDREIGPGPRHHVVDPVADRLPERDGRPRDRGHRAAHLGDQFVLGAAVLDRRQHHLYLGGVDPLHVLVLLGTPGAAAGRNHLGEGEERFLDLTPQPVALGERNSRRADDRNGERSLVERGQEAAAQTGHERGRGHDHHDHQQENRPAVPEAPVESRRVPRSQSAQEPWLPGTKHFRPVQQQERQHRRDGQRHHERGRERRDEGEAERAEQPTLQTGQEEDRHEDQDDDQGGNEDRAQHLLRRRGDDFGRRTAIAPRQAPLLLQPPEDVLDRDDRVVDQQADRDRQAAKRHRVDLEAEGRDHQDPGDQREGNGERRDQSRPDAAEEQRQDHDDQDRAPAKRLGDVPDRHLDEVGLTEVLALEHHPRRQRRLQPGKGIVDRPGQVERVRLRLFLHRQDDRRAVAIRRRAASRLGAPFNGRNVADPQRDAALDPHHGRGHVLGAARPGEPADDVLLPALHVKARRQTAARGGHRLDHVGERKAVLGESGRANRDLELTPLAADGNHLGHAGDREERSPDHRLGHPAQFHGADAAVRSRRRGHRDERDLSHDRRDRAEFRLLGLGGEVDPLQTFADHLASTVDVGSPVELDPRHREPVGGDRAQPAHSRRSVDRRLDREGHEQFDLFRRHSRCFRDHGHRRRGEVREDVHRQGRDKESAGQGKEHGAGDHQQPVSEGEPKQSLEGSHLQSPQWT